MKTPKLTPDEMWVITDALMDKKDALEAGKFYEELSAVERILDKFPDTYELVIAIAGKEKR